MESPGSLWVGMILERLIDLVPLCVPFGRILHKKSGTISSNENTLNSVTR